ncbi:MAG: Yip1 family protein [Halobacteriaceae archaeon]
MPRTPLLRPRAYAESHDARPRLALGLLVGAGTLHVALFLATAWLFAGAVGLDPSGTLADGALVPATALFASLLAGWLIEAGVLHLLVCYLGDGSGSVGDTLSVAGWGAVPDAVTALGSTALVWRSLDPVSLPTVPGPLLAQARSVVDAALVSEPLLVLAAAAWTVAIWGLGLAERHGVPTTGAYLFAGLVAGVRVVMAMG